MTDAKLEKDALNSSLMTDHSKPSLVKPYTGEPVNARKVKQTLKGLLLFVLPSPLLLNTVIELFTAQVGDTLLSGALYGLFMLSALAARQGFKIEQAYHERRLAQAPKYGLKLLSASMISLATGLTSWWLTDYGLLVSLLFAGLSFAGFALTYGLDPYSDKLDGVSSEREAREIITAVTEARAQLAAMQQQAQHIVDAEAKTKVARIISNTSALLENVETQPSHFDASRRFIKLYLERVKHLLDSYVSTELKQATTVDLTTDFNRVLDAIEHTVEKQNQQLLKNEQFDLDVQIEVLQSQLGK